MSRSTQRAARFDGPTTRHAGYTVSQQKRKRSEEIFGWLKTIGLLHKVKLRGVQRVGWLFTSATDVYNLVRMRNLVEARHEPSQLRSMDCGPWWVRASQG